MSKNNKTNTNGTVENVSVVIPKAKDCTNVVKFEFEKAVMENLRAAGQMPIMSNAYIARAVPGIATAKAVKITIEAVQ